MDGLNIKGVAEAVLFLNADAMNISELAKLMEVSELELMGALRELQEDYESRRSGLALNIAGAKVQIVTNGELADAIERIISPVRKAALSQSALETLSYIAYRQPVTRVDIEGVRGVKCDYAVSVLLARGLIKQVGRKDVLGRPALYGTTDDFLFYFGLNSLDELPRVDEAAAELFGGQEEE